jgi:hypothetical protein
MLQSSLHIITFNLVRLPKRLSTPDVDTKHHKRYKDNITIIFIVINGLKLKK